MSPYAYLPMLTHLVCHRTLTYQFIMTVRGGEQHRRRRRRGSERERQARRARREERVAVDTHRLASCAEPRAAREAGPHGAHVPTQRAASRLPLVLPRNRTARLVCVRADQRSQRRSRARRGARCAAEDARPRAWPRQLDSVQSDRPGRRRRGRRGRGRKYE